MILLEGFVFFWCVHHTLWLARDPPMAAVSGGFYGVQQQCDQQQCDRQDPG